MSQRVALVTGALSGIGRATAFAFARGGDRVAIAGRREPDGATLSTELRRAGAAGKARNTIFASMPLHQARSIRIC